MKLHPSRTIISLTAVPKWPWPPLVLGLSLLTMSLAMWLSYGLEDIYVLFLLLGLLVTSTILLPAIYATIGALLVFSGWIMWQQEIGFWYEATVTTNLMFLGGLMICGLAAAYSRFVWVSASRLSLQLKSWQRLLGPGEAGTGLVSTTIAELRLQEELDRSHLNQLTVALLLFDVRRVTNRPVTNEMIMCARQAMHRTLASYAQSYDLPFELDEHTIGIILPLRDSNSLQRDTLAICQAVRRTKYQTQNGLSQSVEDVIHLRIGYAANKVIGTTQLVQDSSLLLKMARRSLGKGRLPQSNVSQETLPAYPVPNLSDTRA